MTEVPSLALPYFKQAFTKESDASIYGFGAVLLQEKNLITYYSKTIGTRANDKLNLYTKSS